jgi:hypothetical protein
VSVLPQTVRRGRQRAAEQRHDATAAAIALAATATADDFAGEGALESIASPVEPGPSETPVVIVLVVTATAEASSAAGAAPTPGSQASDDHLQALIAYAEAVKPHLEAGLAAAQRDGQILEAAKETPEALCGGGGSPDPGLLADATLMRGIVEALDGIQPPAEARSAIHEPLRESARLWGDALDAINESCRSENPIEQGIRRAGAMLALGGSLLNFSAARESYQRLVVAYGIEAVVGALNP